MWQFCGYRNAWAAHEIESLPLALLGFDPGITGRELAPDWIRGRGEGLCDDLAASQTEPTGCGFDFRVLASGEHARSLQKAEARGKCQGQITELSQKRQQFIKEELAKQGGRKDSFDQKVLDAMKKQGAKCGLTYAESPR